MRLLNTSTLKVEAIQEDQLLTLKYAILSHTWGEEEVTFQDMQGKPPVEKEAFSKLQNGCSQAKSDGYKYIWIDTCCIDKSSSAELSEAINSMYRWYQEAEVCYAHMADVPAKVFEDPEEAGSKFRNSRWFTRMCCQTFLTSFPIRKVQS
jgi:hypothetical protein